MAANNQQSHRVIVFSTPACPWCAQTKQYLQSHRINFRNVDVSKDQVAAREMIRKSGQQGVPQLWIDGRVIVGFDKNKIDRYLGIT